MTLKFPLVNLISRGHLPLTNRTACLNFAKNIEDGPATRICYEMMKFDDEHTAAKFLEEAVEAHRDMTEGSKAYFAESVDYTTARDNILMRESRDVLNESEEKDLNDPSAMYKHAERLFTIGGPALVINYLLKMSPTQQKRMISNFALYNDTLYKAIQGFAGNPLKLPEDPSYFRRLFKYASGYKPKADAITSYNTNYGSKFGNMASDAKEFLKPGEIQSLKKFNHQVLKGAGWGVAIAASVTAAIVAISMLYKRFFSAEAKACSAYGGKERTVCMTKARIKACDAAIAASKKALLECGSAKNEEDCIFKMKVEIRSWGKKKALEEEKLRKLTNVNSASFDDTPVKKNDPFA